MKILMRVVLGLTLLVVVLAGMGLLLPRHVTVERSTEIAAPAAAIYPYTSDLKLFNEWSPWAQIDPNTEFTFSGTQSGQGARMSWRSDNPSVGAGSMEITEAVPDRLVRTSLDFGPQGTAMSFIRLDPMEDEARTVVTWGFTTDLGHSPVMRYMGLMFDEWVGKDYEKGLATLKNMAAEQAPSEI